MMNSKLIHKIIFNVLITSSMLWPGYTYAKFTEFYHCSFTEVEKAVPNAKRLRCGSYIQTTNYTCGPAAVMNLMYYYGMLSSSQMNKQTEMRIAKEMGAIGNGTTLYQVKNWLQNHGFSVQYGQLVSTSMIIENINQNRPTIISYGNHWLIAQGYHDENGSTSPHLEFSDSGNGRTEIQGDYIDTMWAVSKLPHRCKGDIGSYIIAVPNGRRG